MAYVRFIRSSNVKCMSYSTCNASPSSSLSPQCIPRNHFQRSFATTDRRQLVQLHHCHHHCIRKKHFSQSHILLDIKSVIRQKQHFSTATIDREKDNNGSNHSIRSSSPPVSLGITILEELSFRIAEQKQPLHPTRFEPPLPMNVKSSSCANTTKSLARQFCSHYLSLPPIMQISKQHDITRTEREEILDHLITKCNIESTTVSALLSQHYTPNLHSSGEDEEEELQNVQFYSKLREACIPLYEHIFTLLVSQTDQDTTTSSSSIGMKCIIALRTDLKVWNMKLNQAQSLYHSSNKEMRENETDVELKVMQEEIRIKKQKIQQMALDLKNLLSVWFSAGMLELRRITYESTPASIIEQIALKEAVHPLRSLDDLRTRLGPNRRCYAFFHPSFLLEEPLVFVHVALMENCIPCSMEDIDKFTTKNEGEGEEERNKKVAVFYSITSTQPGLSGVDLGNFLLKRVVDVLKKDFVNMETFVTLSPLPRFRKWVEGKVKQQMKKGNEGRAKDDNTKTVSSSKFVDDTLFTKKEKLELQKVLKCSDLEDVPFAFLQAMENPKWYNDNSSDEEQDGNDSTNTKSLSLTLKPILLKLAARYLLKEKHRGKPLDGVAKFHVRNGAEMYRLNYMADVSRKGMHNSWGIMVNYRYCLAPDGVLEENQLQYERTGRIEVREGVSKWLNNNDGDDVK
mmetsp:Transcript_20156/g.29673  ORF Transcript_20156/g.29673 Transcript_20156/m.29673 type:complete len:684 (+) Transcript_20156:79-2130(+)